MPWCLAPGCFSHQGTLGIMLHHPPRDDKLWAIWVNQISHADRPSRSVQCSFTATVFKWFLDHLGSKWYGLVEFITTIFPHKLTCKHNPQSAHTKLTIAPMTSSALQNVSTLLFQIGQYYSQIKAIYFIFGHAKCALSATNEHKHIFISFFVSLKLRFFMIVCPGMKHWSL